MAETANSTNDAATQRDPLAWATWSFALKAIGVVALVKLVYLVALCPYELIADEAHYWEWSRRLDLSYVTKGPGVAWTIAASTAVFGDAEWAVRLPAVLAGVVLALAAARLAWDAFGDERAAPFAALFALLTPAYFVTALLMTIDGPYLASWAVAAWLGWLAFRDLAEGRSRLPVWLGLGVVLGVGFLYKYTILLLALGMLCYAVADRRRLRWSPGSLAHLGLGLVAFGVVMSPVLLWNHWHGWPTVSHLIDHLQQAPSGSTGGGAAAASATELSSSSSFAYDPRWTLEFLASQVGLIGPALVLMVLAMRHPVLGNRARSAWRYLVWCAMPVLVMYLGVSLVSDAEGNWPIAGYLTLLALAAHVAVAELIRYHRLIDTWLASGDGRDRPWRGWMRRKPETLFQVAWHWHLAFGIAVALGVMTLPVFERVPLLAPVIPLHRVAGHSERAREVADIIERVERETGEPPIIISATYTDASLLAYYLPSRPIVHCANHALGGKPKAYDFFADTDLHDPALIGRPVVMTWAGDEQSHASASRRWTKRFVLEGIEPPIELVRVKPKKQRLAVVARHYRGLRDGVR